MANGGSVGCDFLLVTALSEELDVLLASFPGLAKVDKAAEDNLSYMVGRVASRRTDKAVYDVVLTALPAMGQVQASPAIQEALRRWRPRATKNEG